MLYDFNLHIGDSIFPSINSNWCGKKITAIDSIPVSNYFRKRFTYSDSTGFNPNYLYEGIGWDTGLFPNTDFCPNVSTMTVYNLTCYSVNDSAWYPSFSFPPCLVPNFTVDITESQKSLDEIIISPNPFTSQTTISFSVDQKNTAIIITDLLGKVIKTIQFTGRQLTLDKAEMKVGIYFVQTTDEQKRICNRKIIIQ